MLIQEGIRAYPRIGIADRGERAGVTIAQARLKYIRVWPATAAFSVLIFIGGLLFAIRAWHDKDQETTKSGADL